MWRLAELLEAEPVAKAEAEFQRLLQSDMESSAAMHGKFSLFLLGGGFFAWGWVIDWLPAPQKRMWVLYYILSLFLKDGSGSFLGIWEEQGVVGQARSWMYILSKKHE